MSAALIESAPTALVVFCDGTEPAWVRWLKPGFRHCFVVVQNGEHWVSIDPLSTFTEISVLKFPPGADLAGWFRQQGLRVVTAPVARDLRAPAPWGPFTCVEAVKRVLGLHQRWVITPWQLYRHLTAEPAVPAPGLVPVPSPIA